MMESFNLWEVILVVEYQGAVEICLDILLCQDNDAIGTDVAAVEGDLLCT